MKPVITLIFITITLFSFITAYGAEKRLDKVASTELNNKAKLPSGKIEVNPKAQCPRPFPRVPTVPFSEDKLIPIPIPMPRPGPC